MVHWLMPRDFFQYFIEMRRVFVAANGTGGFHESGGLAIALLRRNFGPLRRDQELRPHFWLLRK
jgi:hypothetical protein